MTVRPWLPHSATSPVPCRFGGLYIYKNYRKVLSYKMAETKNEKKLYPLTVAQRFHRFYYDYCPKKSVVNIGTSLTIEAEIDFDVLRESIQKAYERSEGMRVRFTEGENGQWLQYVADASDKCNVEFVDFSDSTMEEAEAVMTRWTQETAERFDVPMFKIVMIKTSDGCSGVYMRADHFMMDAQSLICFLRDIIEIYCSTLYDEVDFPSEMASYTEQLEKDLAYEAGSKAKQRDTEYFHKLIEQSEPIFNGLDGSTLLDAQRERSGDPQLRSAINISDSVDSAIDIFHLEEEPTQRLMKYCEEHRVSLVCLLIMGIHTYFHKINNCNDVSINVAIARRATLKEKKSGGTRIHSFPIRTIMEDSVTFEEGINMVRDLQNGLFRHANFDPVEYFAYRTQCYHTPRGCTYEPMSLTYQPMTLKENGLSKLGDIKYKTKWYPNGATTQGMYLTVMHRPDDNGLDFCFEHQVKAVSREQLEYFYYYLCKIMFKGVENPTLPIGEIMKLI